MPPPKKNSPPENVPHVATAGSKGGFLPEPASMAHLPHLDKTKKRSSFLNFSIASRDDATRTHDPYVPNVVR